jgi:hypothetical protein
MKLFLVNNFYALIHIIVKPVTFYAANLHAAWQEHAGLHYISSLLDAQWVFNISCLPVNLYLLSADSQTLTN